MKISKRILADMAALPPLPKAALQLNRMLTRDDTSASDIERVIRLDPALTAQMLKVVNSAAVGLRREVSTLRQAATLLGNRGVQRVVSMAIVGQVMPKFLPGYGLSTQELWAHCAATAVFSEALATMAGDTSPDVAFTAGLLHDVGKLAVGAALQDVRAEVVKDLEEGDSDFIEEERRVLGTDHTQVGGLLCKRWSLSVPITQSVLHHHEPAQADAEHRALVEIVHVANGLAHMMGFGADVGGLHRRVRPEVLEARGLDNHSIEGVIGSCLDTILSMVAELPTPS